MNASSGIGDYDYRYVTTIEAISAKGKLIGLGPKSGNIGTNSVNTFDSMAMEDVKKQLRGGVVIGNVSDMRSCHRFNNSRKSTVGRSRVTQVYRVSGDRLLTWFSESKITPNVCGTYFRRDCT